ncbi:hypothetical protein A3D78_06250 [Candidatus Gottesmanbacteria bacterium RIFCSPHIGHO2_02_FULL_39_14]|uniref:Uncharacterized protein n=1 Tax=Candidatus Gottesmanbacteria bacterium RIFCSPHIGHO2_02_FULL_39_14 TaxID=1798383 RepID=A0A1F5ZXW0_9BACT|nr:MAG: hypothetical protein A3D78_06250 [Candidatus Gottesmanbacteria bacterium RIFCSPHIGHO2_02_FULL_39_14]
MKLFHNNVMNYQRVTVSLPKYIYEDLVNLLGKGKISSFVAEATEDKILKKKLESKDPIKAFLDHRKNLEKIPDFNILSAIHKGRM